MDNPSETTTTTTFADMADKFYGPDVSEPAKENAETAVEEPKAEETVEVDDPADRESDLETAEGDDAEAESDEVDDSEIVVTPDGEEVSLKVLLDAYKGRKAAQADYTKKTTAAAEAQKAVAAEKSAFEAEKAIYAPKLQTLKQIETDLSAMLMADFDGINWAEVRDADPSRYLELKEAKENRERTLANIKAKSDLLLAEAAKEESAKLAESLGWSEKAKLDSDIALIQGYVKEAGIPDDVFNSVSNHKLMIALRDAALYRKLQDKKPAIVKKVREAPRANAKPVKAPPPMVQKTGADLMYN